ncbi:MAG TPA: hypothetical protein VFS40_05030 [Gemmatimonadales bacterium]|nr:hypothetical protein [Gemmatimonadales bacterium]
MTDHLGDRIDPIDEHPDLERLLALREPGAEPGDGAARAHLARCAACREEYERLHQRVARLRALPPLRPARSQWPAIQARLAAERRRERRRRWRWTGVAGLAAAASIALGVAVGDLARPASAAAAVADSIRVAQARSQALEQTLDRYDPEARVVDGRTAAVAQELEDRIAELDRRLEMAELERAQAAAARAAAAATMAQEEQVLRLWRERVGLLDALVDVHLTRASNVGL